MMTWLEYLCWLFATWGVIYLLISSVLVAPLRAAVWMIKPLRATLYRMHCPVCASPWIGGLLYWGWHDGPWWLVLFHAMVALGATRLAMSARYLDFPFDPWILAYQAPLLPAEQELDRETPPEE